MKKNLNLIIVSFFIVLSINNFFGIVFCLPVFIVCCMYNMKNCIYILPISLIGMYVFNREYIIVWIIMIIFIFLYMFILSKKDKVVVIAILIFLVNNIVFIYSNNLNILKEIIWVLVLSLLSTIFFLMLYYLVIKNIGNYNYFEMIIIIISILSASIINYKISLYLSAFYIMYFSSDIEKIFTYVFSIGLSVCLYVLYKDNIFFILPCINSIYLINNILSSFVLVIFIAIISLFYPQYFHYAVVISMISVIYEVFRKRDYTRKFKKNDDIKCIKEEYNQIFNNNVLAFATFLDDCLNNVEEINEREEKINKAIENIKTNYCNHCYLKERCFKQFINSNDELKNLIVKCKNKDYIYQSNLLSKCPYNIEIRKSALITNSKINFENINNNNKIIRNVFSNLSTILRQYVVDNNLKEEIDEKYIRKMKDNIINSGYDLAYFNIINNYVDNFKIELGIRNVDLDNFKMVLENIVIKSFKYQCDVEFSHIEKEKVYFNIINKKNIKIEYSSSNIASGTVSGDNLYIKEKGNKFIAAICDGMGKGNEANKTSSFIISLFNHLQNASISTSTSLQILNSYCQLKEEYENYTTVDFLEIDLKRKVANFYKMSAAASYIFRKNKIEKIENELLPIGNEEKIKGEEKLVYEDDLIIMSSDGVFDNLENDEEIKEYIMSISYLPVEKIVIQILNFLKKRVLITNDDISLIVIKILNN